VLLCCRCGVPGGCPPVHSEHAWEAALAKNFRTVQCQHHTASGKWQGVWTQILWNGVAGCVGTNSGRPRLSRHPGLPSRPLSQGLGGWRGEEMAMQATARGQVSPGSLLGKQGQCHPLPSLGWVTEEEPYSSFHRIRPWAGSGVTRAGACGRGCWSTATQGPGFCPSPRTTFDRAAAPPNPMIWHLLGSLGWAPLQGLLPSPEFCSLGRSAHPGWEESLFGGGGLVFPVVPSIHRCP
jgi:hypothetical protein